MRRQINAELRFQKNMVPKNVTISEPVTYGEYFKDQEIRDDIFTLINSHNFMDSRIAFMDALPGRYILSCAQMAPGAEELLASLAPYKVPCEKAKEIKIDEFEHELTIIFEKKSDYFDDAYLRKA